MEEYEDIEGNALIEYKRSDATDATAATTGGQRDGVDGQNLQVARQLMLEMEKNQLGTPGILRATSGNAGKQLKMRQETRAMTRAGKSAEAAIKSIATQKLQAEKEKMREWVEVVMQQVTHELYSIRQAHAEEMEAQRHKFQTELEKVRGKLQQVELVAATLENKVKFLSRKQTPEQRPTQKKETIPEQRPTQRKETTPIRNNRGSKEPSQNLVEENATSSPMYQENELLQTSPHRKSYAQMATSASPKVRKENTWTEVTNSSRKKANITSKFEPKKRKIIFRREDLSPQKSEVDLMLALNEALQRAGIPTYTRFSRVGYSQFGVISELLTKKSSAEQLVNNHSNILIRAAKAVDPGVIGVEALERWQRLKVHGMSLARYLGKGKMEVLCREIESSTGIQFKTVPRWLISESRLQERLESGTGKGSAIVIIVGTSEEATKLCSKGLRFGDALKIVEKYWKAGPGSVCLSCAGIGHDRLRECADRGIQCVICTGAYKAEDHKCGVTGCTVKMGKIYTHVTPKCTNCGGKHQATAFRCPARAKAQAEAWKEKSKRLQTKNKRTTSPISVEKEPETTSNEMELDSSPALCNKTHLRS